MVRKALIGLVVLLLAGAGWVGTTNLTLIRGYLAMDSMTVMNVAALQPQQPVAGAAGPALVEAPSAGAAFGDLERHWRDTGGAALIVWRDGAIVLERYADGVDRTTQTRSYSLHKSIVGLVAATMASDGLIDLDAPIARWVPAFDDDDRATITIRDALQHTTGLASFPLSPPSLDGYNLLLGDKVERTALKARRVGDPDVFAYSNVNTQVAGAALRRALRQRLDMSYADYLSRRIWAPMGGSEASLWVERAGGAPRFYAGLQATARDWLRAGILIADNGSIGGRAVVPAQAIATLLEPAAGNPGYGLGLWLGAPADGVRRYGPDVALTVAHSAPFAYDDVVFLDGFGGQRVYISRRTRTVVVRTGQLRLDWDDAVLFNLAATALDAKDQAGLVDRQITLVTRGQRPVAVRLLAPADPCACPLIVFSHGAFSSSASYDRILKPLARAGFRIAVPRHTDAFDHPDRERYGSDDWLAARLEDVDAVLDHMAEADAVPSGWIAAGHSFGALIAQIFAGADMPGIRPPARPPGAPARVMALSPPGPVDGYLPADAFATIAAPMLVVTGTRDVVERFAPDWRDHLAAHERAPAGRSTALVFDGIDHYFNGLYGRPTDRPAVPADQALVDALIAFAQGRPVPAHDRADPPGYTVIRD